MSRVNDLYKTGRKLPNPALAAENRPLKTYGTRPIPYKTIQENKNGKL